MFKLCLCRIEFHVCFNNISLSLRTEVLIYAKICNFGSKVTKTPVIYNKSAETEGRLNLHGLSV